MKGCADATLLEPLLAGDLDEAARTRLEEHLAECGFCCRQLETLARGRLVIPDSDELTRCGARSEHLKSVLRRLQTPEESPRRSGSTSSDGDTLPGFSFLLPATDASRWLGGTRGGEWDESVLAEGSSSPQACIGRIAGYELLGVRGEGNMGVVFKAHDPGLRRTVAIKVLHPSRATTGRACQRFLREARAAAAVQSDHVVTIHSVDTHQDLPYLVMEYVEGPSLQERIDAGGMKFEEVRRIGIEAARGLAAAHALGLVHRDIKPANILIARDSGRVKISDFGLAKSIDDVTLTGPGVIAGTPEYMSPEQAMGREVDARSDLFSLGLVLYAACTGRSPLQADNVAETLRRVCRETPKPLRRAAPEMPGWFCKLVDGLLAKRPERRPASARAVEEALSRRARVYVGPALLRLRIAAVVGMLALVPVAAWLAGTRLATPEGQPGISSRQTGFHISGRELVLADLSQAIAAAENGDVIEVVGDGPFLCTPLTIDGKALTIRATGRGRPVFLPDPPDQISDDSWLVTNADLSLEGIAVRWALPGATPREPASLLSSCVVVARGGRLRLLNCRITAGEFNGCVGMSCEEAELTDSHFDSEVGFCLSWNPDDAATMSIAGSVLDGRAGLMVWPKHGIGAAARPRLALRNNTIMARTTVRILMDREWHAPVVTVAEGNRFDVSQHCDLMMVRNRPRLAFPPPPARALRMLLASLQWSESDNVYATDVRFLTCTMVRRPMVSFPVGPLTLADWLACWNLPDDVSRSSDIGTQQDEAVRASADLERVGPGAADNGVPAAR